MDEKPRSTNGGEKEGSCKGPSPRLPTLGQKRCEEDFSSREAAALRLKSPIVGSKGRSVSVNNAGVRDLSIKGADILSTMQGRLPLSKEHLY